MCNTHLPKYFDQYRSHIVTLMVYIPPTGSRSRDRALKELQKSLSSLDIEAIALPPAFNLVTADLMQAILHGFSNCGLNEVKQDHGGVRLTLHAGGLSFRERISADEIAKIKHQLLLFLADFD